MHPCTPNALPVSLPKLQGSCAGMCVLLYAPDAACLHPSVSVHIDVKKKPYLSSRKPWANCSSMRIGKHLGDCQLSDPGKPETLWIAVQVAQHLDARGRLQLSKHLQNLWLQEISHQLSMYLDCCAGGPAPGCHLQNLWLQ